MEENNKELENPAKNIKPTPLPVKDTRQDGNPYRFSLDKANKGKNDSQK